MSGGTKRQCDRARHRRPGGRHAGDERGAACAAVDEGCAAIRHRRVLHVPFIGISISTIGVYNPPSNQILAEGGLYTPMFDITQRGRGVVTVPARLGRRQEHGHGWLLLQVHRA